MGRTWRGVDKKQREKWKKFRNERQSKHHFGGSTDIESDKKQNREREESSEDFDEKDEDGSY